MSMNINYFLIGSRGLIKDPLLISINIELIID